MNRRLAHLLVPELTALGRKHDNPAVLFDWRIGKWWGPEKFSGALYLELFFFSVEDGFTVRRIDRYMVAYHTADIDEAD